MLRPIVSFEKHNTVTLGFEAFLETRLKPEKRQNKLNSRLTIETITFNALVYQDFSKVCKLFDFIEDLLGRRCGALVVTDRKDEHVVVI